MSRSWIGPACDNSRSRSSSSASRCGTSAASMTPMIRRTPGQRIPQAGHQRGELVVVGRRRKPPHPPRTPCPPPSWRPLAIGDQPWGAREPLVVGVQVHDPGRQRGGAVHAWRSGPFELLGEGDQRAHIAVGVNWPLTLGGEYQERNGRRQPIRPITSPRADYPPSGRVRAVPTTSCWSPSGLAADGVRWKRRGRARTPARLPALAGIGGSHL